MRVLLITNMYPTSERPEFGVFVRDQLDALCEIDRLEVELFVLPTGKASYLTGSRKLKQLIAEREFDVFHAHYGLTGWIAERAGCTPLIVTFHGTDLHDKRVGKISRKVAVKADLAAAVSPALADECLRDLDLKRDPAVLPCGVDLTRFHRSDKRAAREQLGLDPDGRYVLFAADPERPEKRFDRATVLMKEFLGPQLLSLGGVAPEQVATWINAANAVLVTSDYEGFGLAALEALACDVPVISTPVGIAPEVIELVDGAHCEPFDLGRWCRLLGPLLADADPRVRGREKVEPYSSAAMAQRVADTYEWLVAETADAQNTAAK